MFPIGFPVFTTCGAPQTECTQARPRKTPVACALMEFKPHNPPILWTEVGIKSPPCVLVWGDGEEEGGGGYLVSLWVSCIHVLEFGIPMGSFSFQFWYPYGSKFFVWSAHPYTHFQGKTPGRQVSFCHWSAVNHSHWECWWGMQEAGQGNIRCQGDSQQPPTRQWINWPHPSSSFITLTEHEWPNKDENTTTVEVELLSQQNLSLFKKKNRHKNI